MKKSNRLEIPQFYLYRRVVRAKLFIDDRFMKAINLDNIAEEAFFSKFHFTRIFKSIYGKTPHGYLTQVRIEKAKDFLSRNCAVSDVCFSLGFESVPSFILLFKKHTGKTPLAFQKQCQKRRNRITEMPLAFVPACYAENNGWK
jgi:AraC-like DNA-binding protein